MTIDILQTFEEDKNQNVFRGNLTAAIEKYVPTKIVRVQKDTP